MKKVIAPILLLTAMLLFAGQALAFDMETLDKVNVLMAKPDVKALLGEPQQTSELLRGLKAEVYEIDGAGDLVGTGCIYDGDELVGQAFIFEGNSADVTLERMKTHGFVQHKSEDGVTRLSGQEDDTGVPITVTILEEGGKTTVITVETSYFDKMAKQPKSMEVTLDSSWVASFRAGFLILRRPV